MDSPYLMTWFFQSSKHDIFTVFVQSRTDFADQRLKFIEVSRFHTQSLWIWVKDFDSKSRSILDFKKLTRTVSGMKTSNPFSVVRNGNTTIHKLMAADNHIKQIITTTIMITTLIMDSRTINKIKTLISVMTDHIEAWWTPMIKASLISSKT